MRDKLCVLEVFEGHRCDRRTWPVTPGASPPGRLDHFLVYECYKTCWHVSMSTASFRTADWKYPGSLSSGGVVSQTLVDGPACAG
jgi:hypothetical protein